MAAECSREATHKGRRETVPQPVGQMVAYARATACRTDWQAVAGPANCRVSRAACQSVLPSLPARRPPKSTCRRRSIRQSRILAPKGPQHVSPGQGNASPASVAAALGRVSNRPVSPVRAKQALTIGSFVVSPLQGCGPCRHRYPGRRSAAIAASLCPGLICCGPFGAKKARSARCQWRCPAAHHRTTRGRTGEGHGQGGGRWRLSGSENSRTRICIGRVRFHRLQRRVLTSTRKSFRKPIDFRQIPVIGSDGQCG